MTQKNQFTNGQQFHHIKTKHENATKKTQIDSNGATKKTQIDSNGEL